MARLVVRANDAASKRESNYVAPVAKPTPRYRRSYDFDYTLIRTNCANSSSGARPVTVVSGAAPQQLEHKHFYDIKHYPSAGDVLVINTSKVIKARLHGTKPTGGKIVFYYSQLDN